MAEDVIESTLETIDIATGHREVIHQDRAHFEAPNWSPDGTTLYFNQEGSIYRIPATGGSPERIDTGFAVRCNNDHGLSPDGRLLAISDHTHGADSRIYILPVEGGEPRLITEEGPSYWHGWSPDGERLAYCAARDGVYGISTIRVDGTDEVRLTSAVDEGGRLWLDDGPDYSPDGEHIYFNSNRTGRMKVYRMTSSGEEVTRVSPADDSNDWFGHPSKDGSWLVFVSYDGDVEGHPPNKWVRLRIMPASGGKAEVIIHLFGGQGTMNVPSWSPDSSRFAFVHYRLV